MLKHPRRRRDTVVLVAGAAVAGWALAALVSVFALEGLAQDRPAFAAGAVVTSASLVATGALLIAWPRTSWGGWGALLVGILWPANSWGIGQAGIGPFASWTVGGLTWIVLTTAALSLPSDQPRGREATRVIAGVVVVLGPLNLLMALLSEPQWNGFPADAWWPTLLPVEGLYENLLLPVFGLLNALLGVAAIRVVARRLGQLSGVDRAALRTAAVALGLVGVMAAVAWLVATIHLTSRSYATAIFLEGLALLTLPVSLVVGIVQVRTARADVVGLVRQLSGGGGPDAVRAALRTTLKDPGLDVLYRVPGGYVDGEGNATSPPEPADRLVPVVAADGTDLGVVVLDPRVRFHRRLVDASISAAVLALENARLQADLKAQLLEVSESRFRIIGAQLEERRRIERDLHDGAQQHLLALALRLEAVRIRTGEEGTGTALGAIRSELQGALQELRDLARGIHPALLAEGGLARALEPVVERLPLPVFVRLPQERFSPAVEIAAYYVICEALADVARSGARGVRIDGYCTSANLFLTVSDDRCDGASAARRLTDVADRVVALGGRLTVRPGPDGATGVTLTAALPLG